MPIIRPVGAEKLSAAVRAEIAAAKAAKATARGKVKSVKDKPNPNAKDVADGLAVVAEAVEQVLTGL